jgi:hypothetical protein
MGNEAVDTVDILLYLRVLLGEYNNNGFGFTQAAVGLLLLLLLLAKGNTARDTDDDDDNNGADEAAAREDATRGR